MYRCSCYYRFQLITQPQLNTQYKFMSNNKCLLKGDGRAILLIVFISSHYETASMKHLFFTYWQFLQHKTQKNVCDVKSDTNNTEHFQKHDKTDTMKSMWDLEKCYYFRKIMICLFATKNNEKRKDSTSRKHEESMSVTQKEHLPPAYDAQIITVGKANNCQLLYF